MFSLATGIYQSYFAPPKLSILIIGLDGSGKTSLLERIKVTEIATRLDNVIEKTSSLPASYAKGGAVAGVGPNPNDWEANMSENEALSPQRQRGAQAIEGGRPARLPPPLPPKQALKSSQWLGSVLKDGFSTSAAERIASGHENPAASAAANATANGLLGVPPPPLVSTGDSDVTVDSSISDGDAITNNRSSLSSNQQPIKYADGSKKPPLLPPKKQDSLPKISAKPPKSGTQNPTLQTPVTKKSSFIQLLRCPSPGRYSDAALGEEEDEEYDDNPASSSSAVAIAEMSSKDALEPWNTEYLKDYYINYQDDEEFDVKQQRGGGTGNAKKMFPLDRIRPTLGQNLAKLDLCGCKCSLFDLSGAEKMRPLWDRYYRDTDAVIYVVNAAETSFSNLLQSRVEFERMIQNEALQRRVQGGLPVLIFANRLDMAYKEYDASVERANNERDGRGISWNEDEEDNFVGGVSNQALSSMGDQRGNEGISERAIDFHDLAALFGFPRHVPSLGEDRRQGVEYTAHAGLENVFLFGGSAKSGEGVRAAMEYMVAHAKSYYLRKQARR